MFALLALVVVLVCALPGAKAFAETSGGTTLGIIIIDTNQGSGQGQGGSDTGTTSLGIRVTNSKGLIETKYTLTLDLNGAPGAELSVPVEYNIPLSNVDVPSCTGYIFLGYYDAKTGGKQYYKSDGTSGLVWDKTKDTTLYAHWQAKTTQISFNQNGGDNGQTTPITATFGYNPSNVAVPDKTGMTFDGYFDDQNKKYFDEKGVSVAVWDKDAERVTLSAHWTLQIDCSVPTSVDIEIDASGKSTTSANPEFISYVDADVKVTTVTSTQSAEAASLFANSVIPDGVDIQLKPISGGSSVRVPVGTSAVVTIPNDGWTIAAGSIDTPTKFAVAFSLSLPSGAQLNYRPDTPVTIANLSYVVSVASTS